MQLQMAEKHDDESDLMRMGRPRRYGAPDLAPNLPMALASSGKRTCVPPPSVTAFTLKTIPNFSGDPK